jgi:putative transposase
MTLQAYRFALDPTPAQDRALRSHCGGARFAFNWGLRRVKANIGQREAEKSYGITGDGLTPALSWSLYSLRKDWNAAKTHVAPWWAGNSKEAYSCGLANLAVALQTWKDSRTGKRKGPRAGFRTTRTSTGRGCHAGSPRAPSAASPGMRCCPGSAGSSCTKVLMPW